MSRLRKAELEMLHQMVAAPRVGVREWARRLGIARGTAQARIDRLEQAGAIVSYRPQLNPAGLGLPILAYVRVDISQEQLDETFAELVQVPEVVEADAIAGDADLICRVIARDHLHLEAVLQRLIATKGVRRTRTEIVLSRRFGPRVLPLVESLLHEATEREDAPT